jgi:hypothetical protein
LAEPAGDVERPEWAGPRAQLVAGCVDLPSGERFRVWYEPTTEAPRRSWRRSSRDRPKPFLLEHVRSRRLVEAFAAWQDVLAWEQRHVISGGWAITQLPPEERERIGLPAEDVAPVLRPQSSA